MSTRTDEPAAKNAVLERLATTLVVVVFASLAYAIWSLTEQNRELMAMVNGREERQTAVVAVGDVLSSASVAIDDAVAADFHEIISSGGVLAFLTTTCSFCERALPFWSELSGSLEERSIAFAAISLHPADVTERYVSVHEITWQITATGTPDAFFEMGIRSVPTTIAVKPGGEVVAIWVGGNDHQEAERVVKSLALVLRGD